MGGFVEVLQGADPPSGPQPPPDDNATDDVASTQEPATEPAPSGLPRQLGSFAVIGVASTVAYSLLYLLLRQVVSAQPANAVALLLTSIANTGANRRFTFQRRNPKSPVRHQIEGLLVFVLTLLVGSGALTLLHLVTVHHASPGVELAALTVANLVATALRFLLLRSWVFRSARRRPATAGGR